MAVRYLLDTNICIYIAKHTHSALRERFDRHQASELAMSVITLGELHFGAEKSQSRERALNTIRTLVAVIQTVSLPETAREHYGQIRAALHSKGRPIGNNDMWLAAHARAEGWILVTNNEREFARIEGLRIENWVSG